MNEQLTQNEGSESPQEVTRKRILLVDDHPLVREGLTTLMRTTPDLAVFGEAENFEEACLFLEANTPDLALIDLALPGKDGIDLIKELRDTYPDLRMLALSMHEESVYAERVLRAGAHGYVMKHMPGIQIIEAIRTVLRGEVFVSPAIASRMLRQLVDRENRTRTREGIDTLSNRELQVFLCIGNGFSSKEIANRLQLNIKTIQTYREHIKHKLRLRNSTDLVHFATQWAKDNTPGSHAPGD